MYRFGQFDANRTPEEELEDDVLHLPQEIIRHIWKIWPMLYYRRRRRAATRIQALARGIQAFANSPWDDYFRFLRTRYTDTLRRRPKRMFINRLIINNEQRDGVNAHYRQIFFEDRNRFDAEGSYGPA